MRSLADHLTARVCSALAFAIVVGDSTAQCTLTQTQKLVPVPAVQGASFGWALDVADDVAVIATSSTPTFYVFRLSGGWSQETVLTVGPAGITKNGVAVGQDRVVLGIASSQAPDAAHVFRFDGQDWILEQVLTPSLPSRDFGSAVAIHRDLIVVGDPNSDAFCGFDDTDCGAVYVYRLVGGTWIEEAAFGSSLDGDHIGTSVSLSRNRLAVGAPQGCLFLCGSGYVRTYRQSGGVWGVEASLMDSGPDDLSDFLGTSVALDGSRLLVGVPRDTFANLPDVGSAKIYEHVAGGWIEVANVGEFMPMVGNFGANVDLVGDVAVIGGLAFGVPRLPELWRQAGSTWVRAGTLAPSDGLIDDRFGQSLALSADHVFVGARGHDAGAPDAGAVYVYAVEDLVLNVAVSGGVATSTVCGGLPGSQAFIGTVGPTFTVLGSAILGPDGSANLVLQVPAALAGQSVALRARGIVDTNVAGSSNPVRVTLP